MSWWLLLRRRCVLGIVCLALAACESSLDKPPLGWETRTDRPAAGREANGRSRQDAGPLVSSRTPADGVAEVVVPGTGEFTSRRPLSAAPATTAGPDGVTLNLLNVPIAQAAKLVLSDLMKLNYTVSDKVTGNVTLQTATPMPRDAVIDAFETALRQSGAMLVRSEGYYRVMPVAGAGQAGAPVRAAGEGSGLGVEVQVVPLKHVSASEMKRLIDPVAQQGTVLRADDARNILFLGGTGRELNDIKALIGLFDVDWMRGMSFALFPVKTSDPEAIAQELETVFGVDKEGPLKGVVRFIPNRRLGSVLVISSKPQHIETARGWIARLDKLAQQGEEQLFVYKIQNRSASELATLLQRILSSGRDPAAAQPGQVAPRFEPAESATPTLIEPRATSALSTGVGGNSMRPGATPSAAPVLSTSPGAPGRPGAGSSFQAAGVKVVADEAHNALVIQATPKEYQRIQRILERLDVLPTQVMLEAVIAEISLNDELKFGLKWWAKRKHEKFTLSDAASGAVASNFPGFSYFLAVRNVQVVLDTLSSVTKVNVVSAPSLMVMDNRKATLQVGDQVPIITQTAQSVTNPDAPAVNTVTMKDTGVILTVTPRVNDSGRVVLDVEQEVSNVARTTSSGIDSPTIQQRRVKTTVVVGDGETIALGGLIQQRENQVRNQVPWLGTIPVVGSVFRQTEATGDRTELVIFLRPMVVRDIVEARNVTEEFRQRLQHGAAARGIRKQNERDFDRAFR